MTLEQFRQARKLFLEACDLAPDERTAFLDSNCDNDEMRIAVEAWLAEDDRTQALDHDLAVTAETQDHGATSLRAAASYASPDEARFLPGTLLDDRYRIIGLLGRGGMGEVYRADDLKLGQAVALKFLPPGLERNENLLRRFITEVRTARQVTHINVCRVYDVGEAHGQHYLSMEYVDGEDLASLLRRIGRLPNDKAVQISRQIAAGLHAAHEQGILHRDLKPANVMIDGRGQVKITDFGLADLEEAIRGTDIRSGTPAYMAPEQIAGEAVTVRSDIYALGLVLYELFTGTQAFEASSIAERIELQHAATPPTPSSRVEGFDRIVEKAILRCLEEDPRDRPASALAVAAALPGGDPLMASLLAGETPSPDMVAAAGERGLLPRPIAFGLLAIIVASVIASVLLADRVWLTARVAPAKTPVRLAEDAGEMLDRLRTQGLLEAPGPYKYDFAYGMDPDWRYLRLRRDRDFRARYALDADRPAALQFWYRQSDTSLHADPSGVTLNSVTPWNPSPHWPGMINVRLDPQGRLMRLTAIPSWFASADDGRAGATPDWSAMFAEAGLDYEAFTKVAPRWTPPVNSDQREAWIGTPAPDLEVRVEAHSLGGRVVAFIVLMPWQVPSTSGGADGSARTDIGELIGLPVYLLFVVGGLLLVWRNIRRRRGDRRGAWRIAIFTLVGGLAFWFLNLSRFPRGAAGFIGTLQQATGIVMFWSALAGLLYFALEPYIRRRLPERMIAWSRAIAGRWRDPLVGRDVLIGIATGLGVQSLTTAANVLGRSALDLAEPLPSAAEFSYVDLRTSVGGFFMIVIMSPVNSFIALILVLLFKVVLRKLWLAIVVLGVLSTVLFAPRDPDFLFWGIAQFGIEFGVFLFVLFRYGLLAGVAHCFAYFALEHLPAATDLTAWHGAPALTGFLVLAALTVYGLLVSQAGRPLISDGALES